MTGRTVDQILDSGAVGLMYFEKYIPILHRVVSDSPWTYPGLCARYDEQRGLDLDVLADDARVLGDAVTAARAEVEHQSMLVDTLSGAWVGTAGQQALADVRADRTLGSQRTEATYHLATAMSCAVDQIRSVLDAKAADVSAFDPTGLGAPDRSSIDGIPLIGVEAIDALAQLSIDDNPLITAHGQNFIDVVAPYLPAVVAPAPTPLPGVVLPSLLPPTPTVNSLEFALIHARGVCQEWLGNTFARIVSAAAQHLVDACVSTDIAVRNYLTTLAELAEAVETSAFPAPSTVALPTEPAGAGASHGGGPGPGPGADGGAGGGAQTSVREPDASTVRPRVGPSGGDGPDDREPATGATGTPGAAESSPGSALPPHDLPAALRSMFGDLPSGRDIVAAIERAGQDLTSQVKALLDDACEKLSSPGDEGQPAPGSQPEPRPQTPGTGTPTISPVDVGPQPPPGPGSWSESGIDHAPGPNVSTGPVPHVPALIPPAPVVDGFTERGHLEAALDGHRARLSLAHNGTVALDLRAPNGDNTRFELRPGPFGLPIVEQMQAQAPVFPAAEVMPPPTVGPEPVVTAVEPQDVVPANPPTDPDPPHQGEPVTPVDGPAPPDAPIPDAPIPPAAPDPQHEGTVADPPAASESPASGARIAEAGPL